MGNLVKLGPGEGEHHAIAGADWTWKVRPEQTDDKFCFFEMVLEPGQGVPAHTHSYAEAFYVVEGLIAFQEVGSEQAPKTCARGDVILAGAQTQHAFVNPGPERARLLSISSAAHARFFDAVVEADRDVAFATMPMAEAFARVAEIGARTDTIFVPGPSSKES